MIFKKKPSLVVCYNNAITSLYQCGLGLSFLKKCSPCRAVHEAAGRQRRESVQRTVTARADNALFTTYAYKTRDRMQWRTLNLKIK